MIIRVASDFLYILRTMRLKWICVVFFICSLPGRLISQDFSGVVPIVVLNSSVRFNRIDDSKATPKLSYKNFIVPAALLTYGFVGLGNNAVSTLDHKIQQQVWVYNPHQLVKIDNYLQFAPAASVYLLNAVGIKGKDNFIDRSGIFLLSNVFLGVTVYSLKELTQKTRPNGDDNLSFPSGHTAEAFAGAEFMRLEYQDKSVWYSIAGYLMAGATGYLRIYNNKHYFSDVVAGAGVGIASTQLAYWLYPKIKRIFYKDKPMHTLLMPSYSDGIFGFNFVRRF